MTSRAPQSRPRLEALDVARGLMLVVSVAAGAWLTAPMWFEHAPWAAVHPIDVVFPAFVALSGAGLAIAYSRRVRPLREVRRALVLLACGLAYNAVAQHFAGGINLATFRVTGVLQLYAVVVLVMAALGMAVRRWWHWFAAALVFVLVQAALFAAWRAQCGTITPECNPSRSIDTALFTAAHMYAEGARGHDPEGVVAILGALSAAAIGAMVGRLMLDRVRTRAGAWTGGSDGEGAQESGVRGGATATLGRDALTGLQSPPTRALDVLTRTLAAALVLGGVAIATTALVPPFKRLWTPSFAVGAGVAVVALLLVLHLLLDGRAPSRAEHALRYPLVALGRNSLLVYFGSHAVMMTLLATGPGERADVASSWAGQLARGLAGLVGAPGETWPFCAAAVLAWTALAMALHRARIYVKA